MKKILPIIISVLVLFYPALAFAQTSTQAILSLDPSTGTLNQGCPFTVKVNLSTGGTDTDGTDAILMFDSTRLTAQSITKGTIYADYPGNNIDNSAGKVTISGLASMSSPFNGSGTLATVNFLVQTTAPVGATQINFDFVPDSTTHSNVVQRGTIANILSSVVNGSYTIGSGTCSGVSPSPTPGGRISSGGRGSASGSGGIQQNIPAATNAPVNNRLPDGGTQEFTMMMAIVGGALTVLGILGIALL